MFRNVIFDWSGTLCNDLPPVLDTINRILDHFGVDQVSEAEFLAEFELPFAGFYKDRAPLATHDDLERLYREFFPLSQREAEPIEHALDFVHHVRPGRRLFVLSAATAEHFHEQADLLGFERAWFERLYLGVRDKREVIQQLLAENVLAPQETCFIGDMRHDIETAQHAGITSIAVLTGYDSAEKLAPCEPDLTVANLLELRSKFSSS
ncbi:MAG: phosphoglycolate phosphatase [Verrucomicrobiales bacterium]|jgi:phosphoglycolate phosphatase